MEKAQRLAHKPHCVDFRVFEGHVTPQEEQVEAAALEAQQEQEALVDIEIQKLNHFFSKPIANGFYVLEYSMLKMYETCIPLN